MNTQEQQLPSQRLIIPLFITNRGCPHRCTFCRGITAENCDPETVTVSVMKDIVSCYLSTSKPDKKAYTQIAFYGGNFTGLDPHEQDKLLTLAGTFIKTGDVRSLRTSTRPDFLDHDQIDRLKRAQVKTVEIGAQSMVDEVLDLSCRGHSSEDVRKAVTTLRENGFETGVHLMAGLPGDNRDRFLYSVDEVIRLRPDMVRIHPTLVFKGTALADSYERGDYPPLSMDEAVDLCSHALRRFERAGIPVIRIGLQPESDMERPGTILAGPYHPAFRSLVEGKLFFEMASRLLASMPENLKQANFYVSPKDISFFRGLNNGNMERIYALTNPAGLTVSADPGQKRGTLKLAAADHHREIHRAIEKVDLRYTDTECEDV
jgi:histone acetyltransferase (RNA polymerase elongator complex component)